MSEHVVSIKSVTRKTYTVELTGLEPRPWPYSQTGRTYIPRRLVVAKRDGNVSSVNLAGPQAKKDGSEGAQWAKERFYSTKYHPEWMRSIIGGLA